MEFKIGNKVITVTPGQFQALMAALTALYAVARAFGLIDVGGIPVV